MQRTVIIDRDIIIYKAAEASEDSFIIETESEVDNFIYRTVLYGNKEIARDITKRLIEKVIKATKSDNAVICLTSSTNFRKEINPAYKINRKKHIKPVVFNYLREYIKTLGFKVFIKDKLEADDIAGILATSDKIIKGDKCIWSLDKDFRTIPCKFARGGFEDKLVRTLITREQADWYFMYQTLTGDVTDGYKGCPDIGKTRAKKLLGNIGDKTLQEMWEIVKTAYINKELTREDALLNARMARILRAEDYDFKTGEIKLWDID